VILADPAGVDDIMTSRALTGARGQYLQGLMNDMDVNDQYVVIKTVPFGMDGATDDEWKTVMGQTTKYRHVVFDYIFKHSKPSLVIADGKWASSEIDTLFGDKTIPIVKIERKGSDNSSGFADASQEIMKLPKWKKGFKVSGEMAPLPRSHMGFFSRVWEGTSGTHVFDAAAPNSGSAFAIVAPAWAFKQVPAQSAEEKKSVKAIKDVLNNDHLMRSDSHTQKKDDDSSIWAMNWELRAA
jgi:hypothetical protein